MPLLKYNNIFPSVSEESYIAPNAYLTGDVIVKKCVTILFSASIRGDINQIIIGEGSNIQDSVVMHTSKGLGPCIVNENVTVGHGAILHGCIIKNNCLIGMGCTILDNAVIEPYCIVGANTLIPRNIKIPEGHLAYGNPVKVIRKLTDDEKYLIDDTALRYIQVGKNYKSEEESNKNHN